MMNGDKNKPFMAFVTGPYGTGNITREMLLVMRYLEMGQHLNYFAWVFTNKSTTNGRVVMAL